MWALRVRSVRGLALLSLALVAWACGEDPPANPTETSLPPVGDEAGAPRGSDPAGSAADASVSGGSVNGRPYAVTVPSSYDPSTPTPLVVLLHGYTASAAVQDGYFQISALAETKGFLVALPDGQKDPLGNRSWNATDSCCAFADASVDDVGFLGGVISDMKARFSVDAKRVFLIGHSNGGFMSHRLACDLSTEIAGIVSVAGMVWKDTSKCNPTSPVAVLQIHGENDETILYGGGSVFPLIPPYPSARETVAMWAAKNGCDGALGDGGRLDIVSDLEGEETRVERHACPSGAAELWSIEAGSHVPRFQASWPEKIWAFLEAHPKP